MWGVVAAGPLAVGGVRPSVLVFCDVDETLIGCKSLLDFLLFHFTERYGASGARHSGAVVDALRAQQEAGASREEANRSFYRGWAGERAATVAASGRRWYTQRSRDPAFFRPYTRAALRAHRARGAVVALVSGSFPAVLDPIAAAVGAAHLLCARPEVRGGVLTGDLVGGPAIAEGKRRLVRELLSRYPDVDPEDCFAYGDHVSDLPMLTEVGHPVVVGDNAELVAGLPGAHRLGHKIPSRRY
ncbi:HAD family hydrolase [Streptomyces sp. NPDC048612]|uniref:HAD family hydrolase n=1 Tax=Streptomyces sp. NPDC048612 TaxID=3365579 RepID=UPI0037101485